MFTATKAALVAAIPCLYCKASASLAVAASALSLQVNVELLTIDKRTFITDESHSLQTLFGENSEGSAQYRSEVTMMAARLATVFASLKVRSLYYAACLGLTYHSASGCLRARLAVLGKLPNMHGERTSVCAV